VLILSCFGVLSFIKNKIMFLYYNEESCYMQPNVFKYRVANMIEYGSQPRGCLGRVSSKGRWVKL
jgi:hypothetical protein